MHSGLQHLTKFKKCSELARELRIGHAALTIGNRRSAQSKSQRWHMHGYFVMLGGAAATLFAFCALHLQDADTDCDLSPIRVLQVINAVH